VKRREPNRWSVKSNPTLARNREPDRRYVISSPTSAEERKLDCRFATANPTLVQRRQADADLQPTITTFYPAMTAFTDQYSLPNIFFDIGQL
jgi:hypothetical protein